MEWEDKLCEAMLFKYECEATLGRRKQLCAQERLRHHAGQLAQRQRLAEDERQRDEEEHRKGMQKHLKVRGAEGERQRAALSDALEHKRLVRQSELQQQQQALHQLEAKARAEKDQMEAAMKQRESLQACDSATPFPPAPPALPHSTQSPPC